MDLPIITAKGTPYEIGFQHGEQTSSGIRTNISYYLDLWHHYCGVGKNRVLEDAQVFLPFIEKMDTDLIQELKGVAEGAKMQFEEILALNARWELNYAYLFPERPDSGASGCTALAVTPDASADNHMYIGQNWDYKPGLKEGCILLHILQDNKPDIIMHTEAGVIGHKGFNSAGFGICMNYIRCDEDVFRPGLPVWLKVRSLLNSENLSHCLGILMENEGPNSANMLMAHRDGEAIDVECAPDDVYFFYASEGILTHSNHFISPRLRAKDSGKSLLPDTVIRSERAHRLLREKRTEIRLETIQSVLTDHFGYPNAICRHRDPALNPHAQWETLTSLIIDLTEGKMHYTEGTPCSQSYKTLSMNAR